MFVPKSVQNSPQNHIVIPAEKASRALNNGSHKKTKLKRSSRDLGRTTFWRTMVIPSLGPFLFFGIQKITVKKKKSLLEQVTFFDPFYLGCFFFFYVR